MKNNILKRVMSVGLAVAICAASGCSSATVKKKSDNKKETTTASAQNAQETPDWSKISNKEYISIVKDFREKLDSMVGVNDRLPDKERNKMFDTLLEGIKDGDLDDRDIYYSLKSIVAAIKCAHLQLTFNNSNPFLDDLVPVGFTWMGNDLIIATSYTDKKYIGCKVLSINGVTVDKLVKKYSTICSYETDEGSKSSLEDSFLFVSDLAYLGVMKQKDKKVTIAIENSNGEKENIDVNVCKYDNNKKYYNLLDMEEAPEELPITYQLKHDSNYANYAYKEDENNNAMYFQYLACQAMPDKSFNLFFDEMINKMKSNDSSYKVLVIDVRWNGGGDRYMLQRQLNKNKDYLNTKKIAVITGKNTYSAGSQAVEDALELFSNVKVYGEPTGQAVHNYTEIARKSIPELGMTLVVPTLLDELPKLTEKFGDLKDSAKPDVLVSQTLEDYKNGIDSIYQAVINDK